MNPDVSIFVTFSSNRSFIIDSFLPGKYSLSMWTNTETREGEISSEEAGLAEWPISIHVGFIGVHQVAKHHQVTFPFSGTLL